MELNLDVARFVVGFVLLSYASVRDLKTRRVANRTWLVGGAFALALLLLDAVLSDRLQPIHLLIALLIIGAAYVLWYFHLLAGGADAKALMTLALLLPLPLHLEWAGLTFPIWTSPVPPALVVLSNAMIGFLALPLGFLVWNVAHGDLRFPALLLGYTLPISQARRGFVWTMERVQADGTIHPVLFASRIPPQEQKKILERLSQAGRRRVWVTPKIPFMVPLLLGFVAAFIFGDILTHFLIAPLLPGRLPSGLLGIGP